MAEQFRANRFIVLEGIEGTGKSTQQALIGAYLEKQGHSVTLTREPGGTALGEQIRAWLLDPEKKIVSWAELFLMFAARAQHVETVIRPALERGEWVISDRFFDSSMAYQGMGRGLPIEAIAEMGRWIIDSEIEPDLVLILDAPCGLSEQRIQNRSKYLDRIEQESFDFFQRVKAHFYNQTQLHPHRYKLIDASLSPNEVEIAIRHALEPFTKTAV